MINESRLDERTGWGHFWSSSQWDRCFLVLTVGALRIFECDQRNKLQKTVPITKCTVEIHQPLAMQESSLGKKSLNKRWKNLSKLVAADQSLSQTDVTVVTVNARKGKTCLLMFPSQTEAKIWKLGVEESGALADLHTLKRTPKAKFKSTKSLEKAFDAINHTQMLLKTNSLLKKPFGLRWEAHPPLLKIKDGSTNSSPELSGTQTEGGNATNGILIVDLKPVKPLWHDLETLQGCTDFLRSSCSNFHALEHAALMVDHFKGSYQMGDSSLPDELRLEAWKGTTRRIVKSLVDQIVASNSSMESCISNDDPMNQLWSASEVWVFGAVHDKIMGACKQMFAINDASLDNILAKLQTVDPSVLGVRAEFENFVLGEAIEQFRTLNRLRTPLEKAMCLRKTVKCIINGIQSLIKSFTGALKDTEGLLPCTDDLLSFMLLLMARAKVKNLHANACFMENFLNLQKDTNGGELMYHITNFVAACSYLQSSAIQDIVANISEAPSKNVIQMSQMSYSADEACSSSSSLFKSSTRSFERSSNSIDGGQKNSTRRASSPSRSYSLDSDVNGRSIDDYKWEGISEESSCFDGDAFNNWRSRDSLQRNRDGGILEFDNTETSLVINLFSEHTRTGWIEREDSRENTKLKDLPMSTCRKGSYAFPGDSPDFILAPTYH